MTDADNTMRAILSVRPGPPEALEIQELPVPRPGAGEVLVAVAAAALNFFDTLIIEDRYQHRPARPFSPGGEVAGTVAAIGDGVTGFAVGDRVAGYIGSGGCSEFALCPAAMLAPVPDAVALETAAVLPIAYGTALLALERARLAAGERLAVLGAAGGTGLAAVELGRLLGATVIACASSPAKLAIAREHGADHLLDTSAAPLKEGLRELGGGDGVDVVYDTVGGELAEPALRALAWGGRHLVIGFAGGAIPRLPLNLVLLKNAGILGFHFGEAVRRDPALLRGAMARLTAWVADGRLVPRIEVETGLAAVPEALARIAGRRAVGKIVVRP